VTSGVDRSAMNAIGGSISEGPSEHGALALFYDQFFSSKPQSIWK